MRIGEREVEITTPRPARPSLWDEHHEHAPEQVAEMSERIRGLGRPLIYATNAEDDPDGWTRVEPTDGDVILETLDIRNNVLRRIDSGRVVVRSLEGSLAWIPDRKPNEARLQARRDDGSILSRALLTDEQWRLDL